MSTVFRHLVKVGLLLAVVLSTLGCALSTPVEKRVYGYTKMVKDDSPEGSHYEKQEPQPAFIPLLFITGPIDIATFPIQLPFAACIWNFYGSGPGFIHH